MRSMNTEDYVIIICFKYSAGEILKLLKQTIGECIAIGIVIGEVLMLPKHPEE